MAGSNASTLLVADFCAKTQAFCRQPACVLWLQGCARNCPGCLAPEWADSSGGKLVRCEEVLGWVLKAGMKVTELVVSGGEPLLQVEALSWLVEQLRARSSMGLLLFTGYSSTEIIFDASLQSLVARFDLVIAGPYEAEHNHSSGLRGSENQELMFLSDRYLDQKHQLLWGKRRLEVELTPEHTRIIGIPPVKLVPIVTRDSRGRDVV